MKKYLIHLFCLIILLQLGCATKQPLVLEEPQPGMSLLVGAVLVENDGVEDVYESHKADIDVVIVGKYTENGQEQKRGFRTKTDENGYFVIQNVPPGSYVLKGIEVDIAFSTRMIISSRWEGTTQIFYPINTIIDNTVRHWPPESKNSIIDMGINYFRIDASQLIFDNTFNSMQNSRLGIEENYYTMPNPVDYYRQKYPDWGWF